MEAVDEFAVDVGELFLVDKRFSSCISRCCTFRSNSISRAVVTVVRELVGELTVDWWLFQLPDAAAAKL